MDNFSVKEKE